MKQYTLVLFLSILTLTIFPNCKRCHSNYLGSVSITSKDRQMIPYSEQSKLIFKSTSADSLVFIMDTITTEDFTVKGRPNNDNFPECYDYYDNEEYDISFKDSTKSNKIFLSLSHISFTELALLFSIQYTLNDSTFYFLEHFNPVNDSIPGNYYFSLQIGVKMFYYVHEFESFCDPSFAYDEIHFVYYTKKQGIVGFKTCKGDILYLAN